MKAILSRDRYLFFRKAAVILLSAALAFTGCNTNAAGTAVEKEVTEAAAGNESVPQEVAAEDSGSTGEIEETGENAVSEEPLALSALEELPDWEWQAQTVFPDRRGKVDDTLAMNSLLSFEGYHGQGKLYLSPSETVTAFKVFINNREVDTTDVKAGTVYEVDLKDAAINGLNTLQVSGIEPLTAKEAVRVWIPYPEVIPGDPEEEGITEESLSLISDIVSSDVESGFTAAQLAVVRNGRLIYENSWGKVNTYLPDGTKDTNSPDVTKDTMFDLASVTKMFATNYALQKLVTDGKLTIESHIVDFLGEEFAEETMDFAYQDAEDPGLETMKEWKRELTVRDLLCHQGGFPASPRYCNPYVDAVTQKYGEQYENILFAGNGATEETRNNTIKAICQTPLMYEPGTKTLYSDVDYMILGLVVEKVSGKGLDEYVKETFYEPMGLKHITYTPSKNGFSKEDCAATELNGNTRDGFLQFPGIRTETIQGEVHDEMAYYSMGGVSGHAGLFSNAEDLAKLASVMLTGGYGEHRFFSRNVMDLFTAPKNSVDANWGLGWWREGEDQRTWYFGETGSGTFGHQGWTGTLVMVDPVKDLVVVYLTNKINSPVTDKIANANKFNGGYYTSSSLGFVSQLLQLSMDQEMDNKSSVFSLLSEMANDSIKLVDKSYANEADYPAVKNVESKLAVLNKYASLSSDPECERIAEALNNRWTEYKEEAGRSPEGILHDMTKEEKIEEMLMPDVRYWSEKDGDKAGVKELNSDLTEVFKKHKFGGVILFADNIESDEQTAKLTENLQKANGVGNDKQKLFIAVDQEGGRVTRIGTGTQMPGNMALGATGDTECAKEAGKIIGSEIKSLGFNMDFAPVVDVNLNPSNPVIGIRSFSDSPEMTGDFGSAFTDGLHEASVISALKHFPGHGDTRTDSHTGLPSIDKDLDTIRANELIPFDKCLKNGADMVMTAHIQYPKIETETYTSIKDGEEIVIPATLSKAVIGGILRKDMGFNGVVITDAMDMAAVSENFLPMDSAKFAINAGVDMMLMPFEMSSTEGIKAMEDYISGLAGMVEKGEIPESRINESVLRILKLKEKYGLLSSGDKETSESAKALTGSKENHDKEWEIAEKAVTLLKNEDDLLPIKKNSKVIVTVPYDSELNSVEFALGRLKEEGVLDKNAAVSVESFENVEAEDRESFIERSLSGNDVIIAVSALYSSDELDPSEETGWNSKMYDTLINRAHEEGKKVVILSAQLPYDAARYGSADAILCCYNARGMAEIPKDYKGDTPQYGPNIPAAIHAVFGGSDITGRLPVSIPELDGKFAYSDRVLYERGAGISLSVSGKTISANETPWEKVVLGDEQFDEYIPLLKDKKVALFSNQTGIVGDKTETSGNIGWTKDSSLIPFGKESNGKDIVYGQHILDALIEKGTDVTAIFSPEHGFRGTADAGESVDSSVDEKTGVPILSLYSGNSHYPSDADMERFDTLVVDMQDVGLRYYTYYISLYYLLDACVQHGKEVVILDRPNPNGFYVDGPILKEGYESGVGKLKIPVVYGMTWGELAKMIDGEGWLEAGKNKLKLTVIPCKNYTHKTKTALINNPSPNIKDMRAVYLYASTCFFENTAFSVGRGTNYPFEAFGSPEIKNAPGFDFTFTPRSMEGAVTPPFEGQLCRGRDLRSIPLEDIWKEGVNPQYLIDAYNAYMDSSPDSDFFGTPDQKGRYWLDLLSGSDKLRKQIMEGKSSEEIKASWKEDIEAFKKQRKAYLLYEE